MGKQIPGGAIGEQYATVVTVGEHGSSATSFVYGANAVASVLELAAANRDLGYRDTIVPTDKRYDAAYWEKPGNGEAI